MKLNKVTDFSVVYDGHVIKSQDCIKYLGVYIDNTLSGDTMANTVIKKVSGRLKFLYRHAQILNRTLRKKLSTALLQCHIDYCCASWFANISQKHKKKLQTSQNKIVRFILEFSPRDHIGQAELNLLSFLNINARVTQLRLNHVFKIFHSQGAKYLHQNFTRSSSIHSHKTRSSNSNFFVPRVDGIASSSFYYNAIQDWNTLPANIKDIPSKFVFKKCVKTHLADAAMKQELSDFAT